ncbi:uroporphyrinogen-III synthase [Wielerella bovis]|uniref:uroporphyrinogen-III synthase n=1 Tax=Wielerella bovis TaxID=2917790 RepID=UPI0020190E91|nr:uroporphyrinogen-III synthase [Wielerella bovis]ULJ68415.1 uroporphyrinogen-III synthase [Wielerella bovis]
MPTLLLVRPENRQAADIALCTQYGWHALPFAPICIVPQTDECFRLPEKIAAAPAIFWVSPTAVEIAATHCSPKILGSLKTHIAVGKATAAALHAIGISEIHYSAIGNDSEAALALPIWQTLPHGATILLIRGQNGREMLPEKLRAQDFKVDYAEIYRREPKTLDWTSFQAAIPDAAWVTSSEMARELFVQVPPQISQKLKSLIYFTHHTRIADTLYALGAQKIYVIRQLSDMFTLFQAA